MINKMEVCLQQSETLVQLHTGFSIIELKFSHVGVGEFVSTEISFFSCAHKIKSEGSVMERHVIPCNLIGLNSAISDYLFICLSFLLKDS